jgi:hypothetical protein
VKRPVNVNVTRTKEKKRAKVTLSFDFLVDDPQAQKIWNGIGLCLREALTEAEQLELMRQMEIERGKLTGSSTKVRGPRNAGGKSK